MSVTTPKAAPKTKTRPSKWLSAVRIVMGLLLLAVISLAEPHIFQLVVRQLISFETNRRGGSVTIERVDGSLWEPVSLTKSRWYFPLARGSALRVETDRIEGEFSWRSLLQENGDHWFRRLSLQGVRGKLALPANPASVLEKNTEERSSIDLPMPMRIDGRGVDLLVSGNQESVRLQDGSFTVSELESGTVQFDQIAVQQPWFSRIFRDVKGTTAIKGSKIVVADLALENDVKVTSLSAEIPDLNRGRLEADIEVAIFGGNIRAQARTLHKEKQPGIEATGRFSNIRIAPLANFLSVSDAAGGTIKDGHFKFRGSPRNWTRAAASLRLEAVNFQWESRQWDSLVLGASLLDRRIQIPELELHQGQNRLSLHGEMALPTAQVSWWQSDFSFDLAAKIENLTEVSALLLPEFRYAAGRMYIDGAVRGKNQQFNGALIVSGSGMTWRNAPIEELHAALKITGNELQVANFELLNKNDFVRGRGVVNILGAKQYWGELRASVADLASYAAILQPPIVPEPLAGGAVINWSGEGSAKGHSGKFEAHLQKLRTLGATGAHLHPLEADLEGIYGPGSIQFSRFSLSDDQSAFSAHVTVGNQALSVQNIRLTHGAETWLEGYALLPLDVWRAWPNTALPTLLSEGVPGSINLTAHNLQLREASRLTGWKWPIAGTVNGNVTAEGPLRGIKASGQLSLQNAQFPLGWSRDPLTNVEAKLSLAGQAVNVDQFTGKHRSGSYSANGQIDFTNLRDTTLKLAVQSDASTLTLFNGISLLGNSTEEPSGSISATSHLDLQITGPASAATVTGNAQIAKVNLPTNFDFRTLWNANSLVGLPPLFQVRGTPWSAWKMDLAISASEASIPEVQGTLQSKLRLSGNVGGPVLSGEIDIQMPGVSDLAATSATVNRDQSIKLVFRPENPAVPSIEIYTQGELMGHQFAASAYGTLSHRIREFIAVPPLTPEIIEAALTGNQPPPLSLYSTEEPFVLSAPKALIGDTEVHNWAPIVIEEPVVTVPAPPEQSPAPAPQQPEESATPAAGTNP